MALVPALDLRPVSNDVTIAHAPSNVEAEQALLGALLYDNAAFERLGDNLQPQHFYEPFHQRLFQAISNNIRKGQLAEPILLAEQFSRDPAFEELGGVRYLADLVDRAPPAANAPDYANAVYDLALPPPSRATPNWTLATKSRPRSSSSINWPRPVASRPAS